MKPTCVLSACGILAAVLVTLRAAADPTTVDCTHANADGQSKRMAGKLAEARAEFQSCQAASCPAVVRRDCTQRMDELERVQPTIVFEVKDASGGDVSAVAVKVDGVPFVDKLEGGALRVDPGPHSFVFSTNGGPPVTRRLVIREGEKERHERITLVAEAPPSKPAGASESSAPSGAEASQGPSTQKTLGLVAGALGIAALAEGGVFGLLSMSAANQQKTDCASDTSCTNRGQALSDHANAVTEGTLSTVSLIAGGALLVGGAVLFLSAPGAAQTSRTTGLVVAPSLGPRGGEMTLSGRF
jgi:hypothetical protein